MIHDPNSEPIELVRVGFSETFGDRVYFYIYMASRLKSLSRLRNRSKRLCEFSRSKSPFTSFSKESFGERGVVSIDRDSSGYLLS